jgi:hypothetical protein
MVYRSRQPVTVQGQTGFADFWSGSEARARLEASGAPDRIFEAVAETDIQDPARFNDSQRAKALLALETAYPGT